ncbi:MAG: SDR family oxidoreductase [Clostridiales bacterium]|uniref:SDR family NAD(P)-dependent oxidoreductase n=1 Tax=Clostridium sp. N3C TaxID=1776758 RepID=UPI00092E1A88|nr:SDR family oxidoreductase [Clostridium sp. N3C]NLZ48909.1 SDR family oxidoreductase [Clostridiales bacterium]SCN24702.1 3-oxoacyl-[acyl-carrier-protein] reductase FabG [Clostridium sp. N3C]
MESKSVTLITGASSGIGYEMARVFARNKHDLVLVARQEEALKKLADKLIKDYGVKVYLIPTDLANPQAASELYNKVNKLELEVDTLVNNAGFGYVGLFYKEELYKDTDMIQVNIRALTELTKLFSKDMVNKKRGFILNVASTGAYHPGPYTAVYYATKAYVLSFTEAIAKELKPYNIVVTALCPGATKTNFSKRAGRRDNKAAMSPEKVAEAGYKALMKKKTVVVPGIANKLLVKIPRTLVKEFVGRYQRRLAAK